MDTSTQSAHGFMAWLKSSALGRQYAEAEAARAQAEAKDLVTKRAATVKGHTGKHSKRVKARDEAGETYALRERELASARESLAAADLAVRAASHEFDRELAAIDRRLCELASPRLHAELEGFMVRRDAMRDLRVHEEARGEKTWQGFAGGPYFSSRPSLEAHLRYLITADATIRGWMLEALDEDEVESRIAKLRAEIPDPHVMVEVESL